MVMVAEHLECFAALLRHRYAFRPAIPKFINTHEKFVI
jgi:hypothetical protein